MIEETETIEAKPKLVERGRMIFRRVKSHIADENWFAVFVDFCIVVLGVFIGLQVQQWNEGRSEAREAAALMERLEYDFEDTEKQLSRSAARLENYVAETGKLIDLLRQGEPPSEDVPMKKYLLSAASVAAQPPVPVSYTEMISSGGLSRISNPELRAALNRYGQNSDLAVLNTANALRAITTDAKQLHTAIRRSTQPDSFSGAGEIVLGYDWEALKEAETELVIIQSFQGDLAGNARRQLREIETILKLLKEETE